MFNIYIIDTQYFKKISPKAWNFYTGGNQPAQKSLKNRKKGGELSSEGIFHYQKMIVALNNTGRVMKGIPNAMKH